MTFGKPSRGMMWTLPEAQALPILKRAFDLGINTWDTVILQPFSIATENN
jgi:versiconal hemiacetal acetate reductase